MNFFYSFTVTALHSLWQSALMLLLYIGINVLVKRLHPLQKRNFLYFLLATQIIASAFTFTYYFAGNSLNHFVSITEALISGTTIFAPLLQYADFLFYIYALIVSYRFFAIWHQRAVFKNDRVRQLLKPSADLQVFTSSKAYHLGIKKKVTLRFSNLITFPFTYGFFKPFILLPVSMVNNLSMNETESIILHELAHIKNHDYLLNRLLIGTDILYFFNPFVKILISKIKAEREKNCDVQVIDFNYDHLSYAETLLKVARLSNGAKSFQLAAVHKTPELLQRISFFSEHRNLAFKKCHSSIPAVAVLMLLSFFLFLLPKIKKEEKQYSPVVNYAVSKEDKFSEINERSIIIENQFSRIPAAEPVSIKSFAHQKFPKQTEVEPAMNFETNTDALLIAFNETPDSTKEFIYNEETQQGKVTQSFKLILIKGEWIMQPQWMILETKPDSTRRMPADNIPPGQ